VYAYSFGGRRYDVGDKQGYLEATVEFALKRQDLREEFMSFLVKTVKPLLYSDQVASTCELETED
ncbi:MAG: gtaB 1, partial [Firmicutes bacterium]|nr:gtaB 1 [Bacillota bacterium]